MVAHRSIGSNDRCRTYGDIVTTILSEAGGQPISAVRRWLNVAREFFPTNHLDDVLPSAEAEELLAKLRGELPGIRAWLAGGVA